MLRQFTFASLALLGLAVGVSPARADVIVRVPFVGVYVGPPGVSVRAPFFRLNVPSGPPVVVLPAQPVPVVPGSPNVPPPLPQEPVALQPPPLPVPPPPSAVVAGRPQTLNEFAASFKPAPGTYETVLINPVTQNPVKVTFSLPAGNPKIRVFPRRLEFDYGSRRQSVEIRFDRKDRVHVQSR
jgi:hypothetical protein